MGLFWGIGDGFPNTSHVSMEHGYILGWSQSFFCVRCLRFNRMTKPKYGQYDLPVQWSFFSNIFYKLQCDRVLWLWLKPQNFIISYSLFSSVVTVMSTCSLSSHSPVRWYNDEPASENKSILNIPVEVGSLPLVSNVARLAPLPLSTICRSINQLLLQIVLQVPAL